MGRNSAKFEKCILRWQGQWRGMWMPIALISVSFGLFACDQTQSANTSNQLSKSQVLRGYVGNTPQTPEQAKQWLNTELRQMHGIHGQPEVSRLNQQLQNLDRRLIRSIGLDEQIPENVFTTVGVAVEKKAAASSERTPKAPIPNLNRYDRYDLGAADFGVLSPPLKPTVQIMPDLSQAEAQQIQYVGMMETGSERFGLVRVGERVYRVVPDMRIGRGQWRVLQFDAAKMQVLINGQTVHYQK